MIHYEVRGKGRTLFFIHGWGYDSRVWMNQVEVFSDKFCVITADLRGHGKSKWLKTDNLLDAFARDILTVCRRLKLKDINFIGWSLGCYVIFRLLEIAPQIFNSIALIGGTPRFLRGERFAFGLEEEKIELIRRRLERDFSGSLLHFRRSVFLEDEIESADFQSLWDVLNEGPKPNKEALILGLEILERADFREEIKRLYVPTLIVCGEGDSITPKGASEYMHKAIKDSKLAIMKGAGHAPFLTKPNEFNRILNRWIGER